MVEPEDKSKYLSDLLILILDGSARQEHYVQLNEMLRQSEANRRTYMEFMTTYVGLNYLEGVFIEQDSDVLGLDMDLWQKMSEYEKTAPIVVVSKEEPARELTQRVVYRQREKHKMSRFSQIFLAMNTAAILFFILFLKLTPPNNGIEVATLSDSINAKWADVTGPMEKGTRFATRSDELFLREGLAELLFDNNAKIVIEGPAEFELLAEDRIDLRYGRLYATVPHEAIGFTISTPVSRIIDLGTEFGVQADAFGDVYLHVIKGKTALIAGDRSNKANLEVTGGHANKVSGSTSAVSDIPCDEHLFARDIDSKNNAVWRQQPTVDLADVVRGGNGQGTGNSDVRLNPIKGFTRDFHGGFSTAKGYLAIPELAFIDGVFVPDGHTRQIVSSRNDVFAECPETSGIFDMDLFANPKSGILKTDLREGTIEFNGREYTDESGHPCILMHSNLGLTFDLDAIRKHYRRDITRFTSQAGIADLKEDSPCNADFYVLVDGQVRYSLRQYKQKGVLNDVSVEIKDTDRFLTLVTTDGEDPDYPEGGFYKRAISCDWCVFTEPALILE